MTSTSSRGGLMPPPGIIPNFTNPESRHGQLVAALSIFLTLTSLFVCIRLYTVFRILRSHGWADYCCFISWLGYIATCSLTFSIGEYGLGVHQWDVMLEEVEHFSRAVNFMEVSYAPVMFSVKLSLLLQLKKLFCPTRKTITWYLVQLLIWSNLLFYLAIFFEILFRCIPRSKIWEPMRPGRCVDPNKSLVVDVVVTAAVNLVSDCLILAIPIYSVWNLQMSAMRKFTVSGVFLVGTCCCASSAARLAFSIKLTKSPDQTWTLLPVVIWAGAELACGIICGCLLICPVFFKNMLLILRNAFDKVIGYMTGARKSEQYPSGPSTFNRNRPGSRVGGSSLLGGSHRHKNYSELDELFVHSKTRTTVGVGATRTASQDVESLGNCHFDQATHGIPPNAIIKMVQIEQSSQDIGSSPGLEPAVL